MIESILAYVALGLLILVVIIIIFSMFMLFAPVRMLVAYDINTHLRKKDKKLAKLITKEERHIIADWIVNIERRNAGHIVNASVDVRLFGELELRKNALGKARHIAQGIYEQYKAGTLEAYMVKVRKECRPK